jgi:predicted site-specific integrase-resolvase
MCLLSKQKFAEQSGLSVSSVNRYMKMGLLRYTKIGYRVVFPSSELERLASLAAPGGGIAEPLTADRSEV